MPYRVLMKKSGIYQSPLGDFSFGSFSFIC